MDIKSVLMATTALVLCVSTSVNAALLTGTINDLPESGAYGTGSYYWGDGINDLYQEWSTRSVIPEGSGINSGWFYSSSYSNSNVDVFVYSDLVDLSTVTDASVFSYTTTGAEYAEEGDTVFFRGTNGYFGAWRIDDIYVNPAGEDVFPYTFLTGQWYFQDDGTGNFSGSVVPVPAAVWLFGSGLVGLIGVARRKKA